VIFRVEEFSMMGVTGARTTDHAGRSAYEQATLHEAIADSIEAQIRTLTDILRDQRRMGGRYRAGADGEAAVAREVERVLVDIGSPNWHLLLDRRWPGSRHANLDLLLVGPPGVLVLDSKAWKQPRIEHGSLWNGQACEDDELDSLRDQSDAVAHALAATGLAPTAVEPYLVLAHGTLAPVELRGVTVVGERAIHRSLVRLPSRLDEAGIEVVLAALEASCPPASKSGSRPTAVRRIAPSVAPVPEPEARPVQQALITEADLWTDLRACVEREPIEAWMTWLHPTQAQLVTRTHNGPARIRGSAGTGKTVVALHRARQLSRQPGARVLVTSYVRTLPTVHQGLFRRLDPAGSGQVEFLSLHAWARRLLVSRGVEFPAIHDGRRQFTAVWSTFPDREALLATVASPDYWWAEISSVIKGRGLAREDEYLRLDRVGRRTPLQEGSRKLVWKLHEVYQSRMAERGLIDWADLIDLALASVRAQALDQPYTNVIVDEVQDLTCQGLRLLHALVGDAEDGLLLVGDGQQAVYPGGFTLREAGVHVPGGRATVLSLNYRNGEEILRRALEVLRDDRFNDLESTTEPGSREVSCARTGGRVLEVVADDDHSVAAALHSALTWAVTEHRLGDTAVLTRTNEEAGAWHASLLDLGVPALLLKDYDGRTVDSVKVGTYQRAKGLEFAVVFVPHYDRAVPPQEPTESDAAYAERAELQRRQLFVAMTRARDRMWLGRVKREDGT
jgi:hypothetical protein